MTVCDMRRGDRAVVLNVTQEESVKERLRALGVFSGANVRLVRVSLFKKTYLLQTSSAKVAMGRDVAEGVRVWTAK